MASRAERRRAAAVLFLFAVLHRSTALDHAAADARAGARKLRAGGRSRSRTPEASVRALREPRVGRLRVTHSTRLRWCSNWLSWRLRPPSRGGEGVCPALASAVAFATRSSCCQAFCAMATRELGAREVVKRAITKSLARTTQTAAKKKPVPARSFAGPSQRHLSVLNLWPGHRRVICLGCEDVRAWCCYG